MSGSEQAGKVIGFVLVAFLVAVIALLGVAAVEWAWAIAFG